jgi:cytochrome c peroxidase
MVRRTGGRVGTLTVSVLAAAAGTWAFAGGDQARKEAPVTAETLAARVELGRRLFFDPAVSRTGRVSCAQCHDPEHGFTDKAHPSQDEFGPMSRRAMPLLDLPHGPMHSDGEFADVRELLEARLLPFDDLAGTRRIETLSRFGVHFDAYGNPDGAKPGVVPVAQRVAADGFYASSFSAAFGESVPTIDGVMDALDAYLSSLRAAPNGLDRFLAGEDGALAPSARRGLALFSGKARCSTCHLVEAADGRAPLRDGLFHDTGIAWRSARAKGSDDPARDADQGLGAHGRRVAERRRDGMKFKTPSLREAARRGPFMHDGSLATLADVIAYYDAGGAHHPGLDPVLRPLALTEDEKTDLLSFLFALSGPERAGLAPAPVRGTTTVRFVEPDGTPIAGAAVGIEPAGDRFRGAAAEPAALRTDARGRVTFEFPNCTHVRLRVGNHGVAGARVLPDFVDNAELVAVPQDCVALRVLTDGTGLPDQVRATPAQTVDSLTRPVAKAEGDPLFFKLVRALSKSEGIYVTRIGNDAPGSVRRTLLPRGGDGAVTVVQADLDLTGGGLTYVDLRPAKATAAPPTTSAAR